MDTQKNAFVFEGEVMGEPESLRNDKTGEVIGHSVDLAQKGFKVRFYVPVKVLPDMKEGDTLMVGGKIKPAPTGWAKATTCDQAKVVKPAVKTANAA